MYNPTVIENNGRSERAYDIYSRLLKDRIIMGNISTYALEFSEPNKIKSLTKVCLKNGADIISPACGLGMKTPLLNIQEIIKTLEEEK